MTIDTTSHLPPWAEAYWQFRAKTMADAIIARKMKAAKCKRKEADAAFREWILEKTYVRIGSFEALSVADCRTIVSFLHRHRGAFKNTGSHGP